MQSVASCNKNDDKVEILAVGKRHRSILQLPACRLCLFPFGLLVYGCCKRRKLLMVALVVAGFWLALLGLSVAGCCFGTSVQLGGIAAQSKAVAARLARRYTTNSVARRQNLVKQQHTHTYRNTWI